MQRQRRQQPGDRLTLEDVAVAVAGRRLLEGVGLHVDRCERVALTGPSGCGKTTLLRLVAGLLDPAQGAVELGGRGPAQWGWPAWRRQVTYVAQRPVMLPGTVEESLRRPFGYAHVQGPFPEEKVRGWLGQLALPASIWKQDARSMSVGEQQRVALVRALAIAPRVLLLDEPTSALDVESARAVRVLLDEWAGRGGRLLAVTHDPQQAAQWSDRHVDLRPFAVEVPGA